MRLFALSFLILVEGALFCAFPKDNIRIYTNNYSYTVVDNDNPKVIINDVPEKFYSSDCNSDLLLTDSISLFESYPLVVGIKPPYPIYAFNFHIPKYCTDMKLFVKTTNYLSGEEYMSSRFSVDNFDVDKNNEKWASYEGALYNSALDTLITCPDRKDNFNSFPPTLEALGQYAFLNQKQINIPASVKTISPLAINNKATDISISPDNNYFAALDGIIIDKTSNTVFQRINSAVNPNLFIPEYINCVPEEAYKDMKLLKSVTVVNPDLMMGKACFEGNPIDNAILPDGIKIIPESLFKSTQLTSIELPDSLEQLEDSCFYSVPLETIILPDGLKKIGHTAFKLSDDKNPNDLKYVVSKATTPPEIETDSFSDDIYANATLFVPDDSVLKYQDAKGWQRFASIKKESDNINVSSTIYAPKTEIGRYDIHGRVISDDHQGLTVIKYSDGSVKKIYQTF